MQSQTLIQKPVVIIGCSRSGTTLMLRNLSEHPMIWTLYEESQEVFYRHWPIDPGLGDRITEAPPPSVADEITRTFFDQTNNKERFCDRPVLKYIPRKLLQREVNALFKRPPIRLVEKTPANCLRIPFLTALFPDAKFIFLIRRPEDVISSLMEGWKNWSGTGDGEWQYGNWHYIVPPGWQNWKDKSLQEICAFQWSESNRIAWEDLNQYCAGKFVFVRYEDILADPQDHYRRILEFCELPASRYFDRQIANISNRVFTHGGSKPRPDKWRELHEEEVESVRHLFQPLRDQFYPEAGEPPSLAQPVPASTLDG